MISKTEGRKVCNLGQNSQRFMTCMFELTTLVTYHIRGTGISMPHMLTMPQVWHVQASWASSLKKNTKIMKIWSHLGMGQEFWSRDQGIRRFESFADLLVLIVLRFNVPHFDLCPFFQCRGIQTRGAQPISPLPSSLSKTPLACTYRLRWFQHRVQTLSLAYKCCRLSRPLELSTPHQILFAQLKTLVTWVSHSEGEEDKWNQQPAMIGKLQKIEADWSHPMQWEWWAQHQSTASTKGFPMSSSLLSGAAQQVAQNLTSKKEQQIVGILLSSIPIFVAFVIPAFCWSKFSFLLESPWFSRFNPQCLFSNSLCFLSIYSI